MALSEKVSDITYVLRKVATMSVAVRDMAPSDITQAKRETTPMRMFGSVTCWVRKGSPAR